MRFPMSLRWSSYCA